jgi:hypothetical protein
MQPLPLELLADAAMSWMQCLKLFAIDIQTCQRCGGRLKVIASIEDPVPPRNSLTGRRLPGRV